MHRRPPNHRFWKNRRVLITGHTGFKGCWLSLWLKELGAEVAGYALEPQTDPSMFDALNMNQVIKSYIGDVRNPEAIARVVQDFQPSVIVHMAAQALVLPSYENPVETYSSNVMGTVNVLEAGRRSSSVETVVNVTTDKVYENTRDNVWGYREIERLGGHDPYSNSKACSELVTQSYRDSFFRKAGKSLVSCRAGNVIGGGDWSDYRLIPDCVRAFSKNEPVQLRNPNHLRPWQHVLEPLRGYLLAAESAPNLPEGPFSWNFGPNVKDTASVSVVIDHLVETWKGAPGWVSEVPQDDKPHEANTLRLDSALARRYLEWEPCLTFEEALRLTAEWYEAYYKNRNSEELRALTNSQISEVGGVQ